MRLGVAGLALALGTAGCGDDSDDDDAAKAPAAPKTLAAQVGLEGDRIVLDAPATIAAGAVTLQLANSAKVPLGVEIIRVDGEQSGAEVVEQIGKANGPIPAWIHGAGGAGVAAPGGAASGTQILQPGTHYLVAERDDDDEAKPLTKKLEVTGTVPENAALPKADARIVADEYSFEATGLKAGQLTVEFDNVGKELHHAIAFPIEGQAKIKDVAAFFASQGESDGPPPIDFEGGTGTPVIDGGAKQTVDLELKSGRYALVCFIPDRAGSPPHVAKGMLSEVTVE